MADQNLADELLQLNSQVDNVPAPRSLPTYGAEVAESLESLNAMVDGGTPEKVRKWQDVELQRARQRYAGQEENPGQFLARRMIPFGSDIAGVNQDQLYKAAKSRFEANEATPADIEHIAAYDRVKELEATGSQGRKLLSGLARIPAIIGEAGIGEAALAPLKAVSATSRAGRVGLGLAKTGATTAAMPSMYLGAASERSIEQGGATLAPENIGPAFGMGMAQTAVLGSLQGMAKGLPTVAARTAARTGVGMAEQAGVDVAAGAADELLPERWKLKTRYGLLGDIARGKHGEAGQKAVQQAATFAVFSLMHAGEGRQGPAEEIMPAAARAMDRAAAQGVRPEVSFDEMLKAHRIATDYQIALFAREQKAKLPEFKDRMERELKIGPYKEYGGKLLDAVLASTEFAQKAPETPPERWLRAAEPRPEGQPGKPVLKPPAEPPPIATPNPRQIADRIEAEHYANADQLKAAERAEALAKADRLKGFSNKLPERRKDRLRLEKIVKESKRRLEEAWQAAAEWDAQQAKAAKPAVTEPAPQIAQDAPESTISPERPTAPETAPPAVSGEPATPPAEERVYHIPQYKEPGRSAAVALDILARKGSAPRPLETWDAGPGKGGGAGFEANFQPGHVGFEFDPKTFTGTLERGEEGKPQGRGTSSDPLRYNPGLKKIVFRGREGDPQYGQLKEMVAEINKERADAGLMKEYGREPMDPVKLELLGRKPGEAEWTGEERRKPTVEAPSEQIRKFAEPEPTPPPEAPLPRETPAVNAEIQAHVEKIDAAALFERVATSKDLSPLQKHVLAERLKGRSIRDISKDAALSHLKSERSAAYQERKALEKIAPGVKSVEELQAKEKAARMERLETGGEGMGREEVEAGKGVIDPASMNHEQVRDELIDNQEEEAKLLKEITDDYKRVSQSDPDAEASVQREADAALQRAAADAEAARAGQGTPPGEAAAAPGPAPAAGAGPEPTAHPPAEPGGRPPRRNLLTETGWHAPLMTPQQLGARLRMAKINKDKGTALTTAIRQLGGINPDSFTAHGMDVQAIRESPLAGILKDAKGRRGTKDLSEMVEAMADEGHLNPPHESELESLNVGDWLVSKLESGMKSLQSNLESQHAKAEADYHAAQRAAQQAGHSQAAAGEVGRQGVQAGETAGTTGGLEEIEREALERELQDKGDAAESGGSTDFNPASFGVEGMGAAGGMRGSPPPPPGVPGAAAPLIPPPQPPKPAGSWFRSAKDWLASFGQKTFPALTRLSRGAGEKLAAASNGRAAAGSSWEYYSRILKVGNTPISDLPPAADHELGTTFAERRMRHYREHLDREFQRLNAAAKTPEERQAALEVRLARDAVRTFVGQPGSPLQTEQQYQDNLTGMWSFFEGVKQHWTPEVEANYRSLKGLDPNDAIDAPSQLPGLPLNMIAVDPNTPGAVAPGAMAGPRQGMQNLRLRRPGFMRKAELASPAYDTRLSQMMQRTLQVGIPAARRAEFVRQAIADGVMAAVEGSAVPPEGFKYLGLDPAHGLPGLDPKARYYVHPEAYRDVVQGLGIGERPGQSIAGGVKPVTDVLYNVSLMSPVELMTHMANHVTALFRPGMGVPLLNLKKTFENARDLYRKDPEMLRKVADLAAMSASFGHEAKGGIAESIVNLGRYIPGIDPAAVERAGKAAGKYDPTTYINKFTSGFIDVMQKAVRVQLSEAYDAMQRAGHFPDSATAKRDFINQAVGNYNTQAGNRLAQFLKDSGLQSFATAAHTYTAQGVKSLWGGAINAPTTSRRSNLQLRGIAALKMVPMLAMGPVINALAWGTAFPANVPAFAIKTREDDDKVFHFDPLSFTGLRRGARATGVNAVVEGLRQGQTTGQIADQALLRDIPRSGEHMLAGPPVQSLHTLMTGEDAMGHRVAPKVSVAKTSAGMAAANRKGLPPPGSSQALENAKAAGLGLNPLVKSFAGGDRPKTPRTWWENIMQSAGPFGERSRDVKKK